MSDLISRDDAIKAFEEEKQKAKEIRDDFAKFPDSVFEQSIYNEAVKAWRTAIYIVKKFPTVVRCADCKHYTEPNIEYCELYGAMILWSKDDFCSRGERRTDG